MWNNIQCSTDEKPVRTRLDREARARRWHVYMKRKQEDLLRKLNVRFSYICPFIFFSNKLDCTNRILFQEERAIRRTWTRGCPLEGDEDNKSLYINNMFLYFCTYQSGGRKLSLKLFD